MATAAAGTSFGESREPVITTMELDVGMVRAAFPDWCVGGGPGRWFAVREGVEVRYGPRSLLRRYLNAPDLAQLAEKLGLQQHLDGLDAEELREVWERVTLPLPEVPGAS
jgi:hypothetical protein